MLPILEQLLPPLQLLQHLFSLVTIFKSRFGYGLRFFLQILHNAIAENRGKAQAASLRKTQLESLCKKLSMAVEMKVSSTELKKGDIIVCEAGDIIPADGEVIEGLPQLMNQQ